MNRLTRGLVLGVICTIIIFAILILFRDELTVGVAVAAPSVILIYFVLGRFFILRINNAESGN
jgi:hypothetical protein